MHFLGGLMMAGAIASGAGPQTPPIFNPGAPGQASRVITAEAAVAMSRTGFIQADVDFMRHMIVHHAQAVEMVGLLETRGEDQTVGLLGRRIALSQAAEMDIMRDWLAARGLEEAVGDPHAGHAGMDHAVMGHGAHGGGDEDRAPMPGMLTPRQMRTLAAADGPEFDRLFLEGMIQHHQGALDMVDVLLAQPGTAQDPLLSGFASSVVADQSAEILRMQSVLSAYPNPS